MAVFLMEETTGPTLFLQTRDPSGPLTVLRENEPPAQQWALPSTADELVTREQVRQEIWDALDTSTLSKPARRALEKFLEEQLG